MDLNEIFSFKSPRIQCFSIPSNIIYYITQNPVSPKGLQKLQQTCKWFFSKNAILVVHDGLFTYKEWPIFKNGRVYHAIHNLNAKFWFTGKLEFRSQQPYKNAAVTVCSKIYKNNITSLSLDFIDLNIQEFEILTSSNTMKKVYITNSYVFDDQKNDISIVGILNRIPTVTKFRCFTTNVTLVKKEIITNSAMKNLVDLKNDNSIEEFAISGYLLSPTLDPEIFCSFIKKVAAPKASFSFYLDYSFPEQKAQIEAAIKKMISKKWKNDKQKPFIGMSHSF